MAGRRICAGYYRRYDDRVVYVVSLATDADTEEGDRHLGPPIPSRMFPGTTPPAKSPSAPSWR